MQNTTQSLIGNVIRKNSNSVGSSYYSIIIQFVRALSVGHHLPSVLVEGTFFILDMAYT